MDRDYTVSNELRDKLDEENARFVLSRADLLVNSTLEQLRKSTDRAYTLFGLLITAFSGLTAFALSASSIYLAVSTCKCTARKVKEYFRKNTQKGYENLIFLSGDGLFFQQLC